MAWKGIKHTVVGDQLSKTEWESDQAHELDSGSTLPETGTAGDLFKLNTDGRLYTWID